VDTNGASNPDTLFREAMSRVAGHVHVIATGGPAGLAGVTATAVSSVSDAPASMLVCLNASSRTLERIRANAVFSINALAARHEPLARVFAGEGGLEGAQRFRSGDGWDLTGRAPRLPDAMACFVCDVADITPVGTHVILIGKVELAKAGDDVPPLLYHRRQYWGA
jgi:flavin reductase